ALALRVRGPGPAARPHRHPPAGRGVDRGQRPRRRRDHDALLRRPLLRRGGARPEPLLRRRPPGLGLPAGALHRPLPDQRLTGRPSPYPLPDAGAGAATTFTAYSSRPWDAVYDPLDSYYLPFWGFEDIDRPGPSIAIWTSSG